MILVPYPVDVLLQVSPTAPDSTGPTWLGIISIIATSIVGLYVAWSQHQTKRDPSGDVVIGSQGAFQRNLMERVSILEKQLEDKNKEADNKLNEWQEKYFKLLEDDGVWKNTTERQIAEMQREIDDFERWMNTAKTYIAEVDESFKAMPANIRPVIRSPKPNGLIRRPMTQRGTIS